MSTPSKSSATLLITCPDQKGLVASVSNFLFQHNANILQSDQHQDEEAGLFLMRVEWDLSEWDLDSSQFHKAFQVIADRFQMQWRITYSDQKPRVAVFVSQQDHCLADLLYKKKMGELHCEIPIVVSNHTHAKDLTEFYGTPFHHISIDPERKQEVEKIQIDLLQTHQIDLVVLARYMQILTPAFVEAFQHKIINIHHSFLPAFIGAKPYHQAFARGVKLIGATSHYVTEGLDEGPIIHQDVIGISHRDQVADLIQKGRDLEKIVLSRAVQWHVENRVFIYGKKTVVFT
jgi:formyltetrahydrofolate deformylase